MTTTQISKLSDEKLLQTVCRSAHDGAACRQELQARGWSDSDLDDYYESL